MGTLKASVRRTVRVERGADGGVVVKRFHAPGAFQGRRDRRRAERELETHARLAALGLPVPEPVGVRLADGPEGARWELVTRYVEGARNLRALLDGEGAWPERDVLARLGRVLARAHTAGLDHPDLHAGNVLVDARGDVWLVDLAGARVRKPDAARAERDLVRLAADLREVCAERSRARGLAAWRRASPPSAPRSATWPHRLEEAARARRRELLERHRGRWTRASGVCTALALEGRPVWIARELEPEPWLALAAASRGTSRATSAPGAVVLHGRWRELRASWYAAARLAGHRLPALRPALLARLPEPRMVLRVPEGARPARAWLAERPAARVEAAAALGALAGGAHDRGLDVRTGEPWLAAAGRTESNAPGGVVAGFGLVAGLAPLPPGRQASGAALDAWLARPLERPSREERDAFRAAWIDAHRAGRRERLRLAAELGRG